MNNAHFDEIVRNHQKTSRATLAEVRAKISELETAQKQNQDAFVAASLEDNFDKGMIIHEKNSLAVTLRQLYKQHDGLRMKEEWEAFKSTFDVFSLAMCWVFCLQRVHPNMWIITARYVYLFANTAAVFILCTKLSDMALFMVLAVFVLGLCKVPIAQYVQSVLAFGSLVWAHVVLFKLIPVVACLHGLLVTMYLIARAKQTPFKP